MNKLFVLLVAGILVLFSCKSERQERIEKAAEELEEAVEKIAEAAEEMAEQLEESLGENSGNMAELLKDFNEGFNDAMSDTRKMKAINFRELKNLMPEKAAGLPRQRSKGESNSMMGINVSEAEAIYYKEGEDPEIKIKIVDMGSMSGFMRMGAIGWAMTEFERETENGFERTTVIDGHKAFEKYDDDRNRGEINIIIANRFLIEIRGRDVGFKALKETASGFDFDDLISLAENLAVN